MMLKESKEKTGAHKKCGMKDQAAMGRSHKMEIDRSRHLLAPAFSNRLPPVLACFHKNSFSSERISHCVEQT